jgi:hypothetical protein
MTLLQWGIVASMVFVVAGRLVSPRLADYLVAEPTVQRRMRKDAASAVGVVAALFVFTSVSIWLWLVAVSPDSCAWIAGIGGCLAP